MVKRKGLGQANILRTNNNTSTGYGVAYADEVSGHRTVANLTALYALNDWQLSASGDNTNSDAVGQLWYVVDADGNGNGSYYQLKDWSKRKEAAGWSEFKGTGASTAEQEIIYDVSARNGGAVFESLQALLNSSNLSTLIPSSVRCGGMSIRFVQSSDNKYVQYRLIANTFSTTVTDWQGVDDEPTTGSNNLVKSGGVADSINKLKNAVEVNTQDITHIQTTLEPIDKKVNGGVNTIDIKPTLEWKVGRVFTSGINTTEYPNYKYAEIECKEGDKIRIAASYTPASSVFFGYKDGSRITQLIAGTGTGIDEQIFECIDATYVVCQPVNSIRYISVLEKTVKTGSAFEKLRQELTDEIVKKIEDAPIDSKQYVRKDGKWQEFKIGSKEPIITDLLNSVEWKNGRVVGSWIDTSATYSKLCEIEIAKDGDELIVASNTSGPANIPFLSKKTDATHATNVISSTDGGAIPEQRIVCEKGVYIVCIYSHPTTDVTVLTKLEYPVDEQKEENKRNRGFLYGKTIASLGDSLATSGLWQNELVKKGAIFDAEKNYTAGQLNYSEGGTVTCDAKDVNCGHIRARRLVEDGIVSPDVIFIENVNDSRLAPPPNHETPSDIDDEPFFLTDVINYATTYNSKQDAINAWENNFASIAGSVTAKKGVAFLLKYNVNAKLFTIDSAPTQDGYIEITATGNDVKRITLTTSDTVGSVIEKILSYDYIGWSDSKKSANGVLFSPSITGDVDITANTCGLTFTKTQETSTNSITRCFCSVDINKWSDKSVWKENPGLYASYKGIVEYLQNAFPTAQIVFFIPETWGFNYNASIYKRADGTIDVDKIAKSYNYVGYLYNLQKKFCERYNLRVIDVRGKCGANYINISQFNAPDEVHPKELGYQRWGEQIVRELN